MKFLKILGIVVLVIIIVVAILGFIAPSSYDVKRTVVVNTPQEFVFDHVKYWKNWTAWSPWAEQDPAMEVTVEGTDGEEGSVYRWEGDPDLTGSGSMTNTGITPNEEIRYHLHFLEPWESESEGYVRVKAVEKGTEVAWGFHGKTPFPVNIFMLFASMDEMIGGDFEKGLTLLKNIVEKKYTAIREVEVKQAIFPAKNYAAVRGEVSFEEMPAFYEASFATLMQEVQKGRVRVVGAPAGLYFSWDEQQMRTDMAAAVPIRGNLSGGEIEMIHVPAQTAFLVDHYGSYENLGNSHEALDYYLAKQGLAMKSPVIEEYITDPTNEPDTSKWLTKIYYLYE